MKPSLPPKQQKPFHKRLYNFFIAIAILTIYGYTLTDIEIKWGRVFSERTIENIDRVIPKLFAPDFSVYAKVMEKMIETLFIAYTGTLMAAVLAIPFAFLAASNMFKSKWVNTLGKWILNGIRAFPELMLALIFVASIGPHPFAGVLAIGIHSIGMLGKLYAESIEAIDMNVVEAMEANGANKIQTLFYGILPQVIPDFLSYGIYRFEIDVRASTILGIIGAGGIGTLITISVANRNWSEVGMILLVIIVVVTIIDYISSFVRKRIV